MELPTCMYPLPVESIGNHSLQLPRCMYDLQPIMPGPPTPIGHQAEKNPSINKESVSAFESRQENLLVRLRQLQSTVDGVRESLGIKDENKANNKAGNRAVSRQQVLMSKIKKLKETLRSVKDLIGESGKVKKGQAGSSKSVGPLSLVVRASPSHPPYSLLCLISALKQRSGSAFVLETSCHEHSSLQRPLPNSLKEFLPESDACEDRTKVTLRVSLVWKEVGRDVEMGLGLTVIRGEANVMRYAARRLGFGENSERTDSLLDDCCTGLVWGDQKEQARVLKRLEDQLSKKPSVCESDSQPGLMDFAVYSALVNSSTADAKGAAAVKKWSTQCQALSKKGKGAPANNNNKKTVGKDSKSRKASSGGGGNPGRGWRNRTKSKSKSKTPPVASA